MINQVTGFAEVMSNLNKAISQIEKKSVEGLMEAAVLLRKDMDERPPLIPVDTNNLRSSWVSNLMKLGSFTFVVCGFTANYATLVHERLGAKFKRPGAGPKFFQAAILRNHHKILELIASKAKLR